MILLLQAWHYLFGKTKKSRPVNDKAKNLTVAYTIGGREGSYSLAKAGLELRWHYYILAGFQIEQCSQRN